MSGDAEAYEESGITELKGVSNRYVYLVKVPWGGGGGVKHYGIELKGSV